MKNPLPPTWRKPLQDSLGRKSQKTKLKLASEKGSSSTHTSKLQKWLGQHEPEPLVPFRCFLPISYPSLLSVSATLPMKLT